MRLNLLKIKRVTIWLIRFGLGLFFLNRLSKPERSGSYNRLTTLKFLRKNILDLPFERGLTIRGVSYSGDRSVSLDAFIRGLRLKDNNLDQEHFFSSMSTVFMTERNQYIGDLNNGITDPSICSQPLYCFSYPWEALTVFDRARLYPSLVLENRQDYSNDVASDIYDVSHIRSHFNQFSALLRSIQCHGLRVTQTPPKVYILKKGQAWKWIMSGDGNHRVYCAHLLGHTSISVCIEGVIDLNDLEHWSARLAHKYSRQDLLDLFEIVWQGDGCVRGVV